METDEQRRARRGKDQQTYGCIFMLALTIGGFLIFWLAFGPNGFLLDK